jgi:hypothetical protein
MVVQIVQEQPASIAFVVFIVLIPLYVVETQMRELNGFDFSASEIARRRDRDRRYKAARNYHFRDRSKDPRPDFGPMIDLRAA